MSRLSNALESGEFAVTGEVAPPRGTDTSAMLDSARILEACCHAVNVTDNQAATLHLSSLGAAALLSDEGIEPVLQITTRDRNRLALQSDLLAAAALGIENLLLLTGDDPRHGDHPETRSVFDLDSTQLIQVATSMNEGRDMQGQVLSGATRFVIGAATFPEAEPWDIQLGRTKNKIAAGARFFQTQAFFDPDHLERAVREIRASGARVLAGVLLLKGPGVIEYVNRNVAGLFVPEAVSERIAAGPDPLEASIDFAIEQVAQAAEIADGVHIMALGLDDRVPEILERSGVALPR
jgi:5,10-methylenetetrahydrofolate reductase